VVTIFCYTPFMFSVCFTAVSAHSATSREHSGPRVASEPKDTPMITELEFKSRQSEGYNRIPLLPEAFTDLETPLLLYLKLAQRRC
jgi:hypothetical protein